MKQTVLSGISSDAFSVGSFELPDADVDLSWLDLGDIFQAVGEFFSSFLD